LVKNWQSCHQKILAAPFLCNFCTVLHFSILQDSVATCFRCGWKYCNSFVEVYLCNGGRFFL